MDVDEDSWCYGESRDTIVMREWSLNVMIVQESEKLAVGHSGSTLLYTRSTQVSLVSSGIARSYGDESERW